MTILFQKLGLSCLMAILLVLYNCATSNSASKSEGGLTVKEATYRITSSPADGQKIRVYKLICEVQGGSNPSKASLYHLERKVDLRVENKGNYLLLKGAYSYPQLSTQEAPENEAIIMPPMELEGEALLEYVIDGKTYYHQIININKTKRDENMETPQ